MNYFIKKKKKDELGQIRNICKRVIDAWTRILTDNIVDYANVEMNEVFCSFFLSEFSLKIRLIYRKN